MKLPFFLEIILIKIAILFAFEKCDETNKICRSGRVCFQMTNDKYECVRRCHNGLPCDLTKLKYPIKSLSKCGYECPKGLSCYEVYNNAYRCSVKCLKNWKCFKSIANDAETFRPVIFGGENVTTTKKSQAFLPLITPEEFLSAVKAAGYSEPNAEKFHFLVSQAETAGGIKSKRELAMFLAQILWESDGLKAKREYACISDGCPFSYKSKEDYPGRSYYGRGYIQLTWYGNYRDASFDLFNDDRLLKNPELVADDEKIAWATAFWFWKTHVSSNPGVAKGEFGAATKEINGILECSGPNYDRAKLRFKLYSRILKAFKIEEEPNEAGCYPLIK